MGVILGRAKFQPSTPKETFSNCRLNKGGEKNVRFLTENRPYLGNGAR